MFALCAAAPASARADSDAAERARSEIQRLLAVARNPGRIPLAAQPRFFLNPTAHAVRPNSDVIDFSALLQEIFTDAARRRDELQAVAKGEKQKLDAAKRAYVAARKQAHHAKRDAHRAVDGWAKGEKNRIKQLKSNHSSKDAKRQLDDWIKSEKARLRQMKDRKPGKDLERGVKDWARGEKERIKRIRDKRQRQNEERNFKNEERRRKDEAKNADKNAKRELENAERAFKAEERSRKENLKRAEKEANERRKREVKSAEDAFKAEEKRRRRAADAAERDANARAKTEWQSAQNAYRAFQEELKNARFEAKSMPRYEKQLRPTLLSELKKLNDDLKGVTNNASGEGVKGVSIGVIAGLRPDVVLGYLKGIVSDKIRPSVEGGVDSSLTRLFGVLDAVVGAAIKAVVAAVGSIPFVGGALAAVAASAGSKIYSAVKRTVTSSVRVVGQRVIRRLVDALGDKLLAAVSRKDARTDAIVAAARAAAAESNGVLDKASKQYAEAAAKARAEGFNLERESKEAAKKLAAEAEADQKKLAKAELEASGAK